MGEGDSYLGARTIMKNSVFIVTKVLRVAVALTGALISCSGPVPEREPEDEKPGSIQGELAIYIATFDDGTSDTSYFLRDAAGSERRLRFANPPDVTTGARISVKGIETV